MTNVSSRKVFSTDYNKLEDVKLLADQFGPGMTVYKHPDRNNYNITHSSREKDLCKGSEVVYRTGANHA